MLKYTDETILSAMAEFADKHHGIPPTLRELRTLTGITSTSVVNYRLHRLVARGLCYMIDDGFKTSRAITISPKGRARLKREKAK